MSRIIQDQIISLSDNEIFVFGSNLSGRHGRGAAKTAIGWGAIYGQAEGLQGKTYAIPTVDKTVTRSLSIEEIKPYVERFIKFAQNNPQLIFMVTEIGCGLAGMTPEQVAPLFKDVLLIENIYIPNRFYEILKKII